MDILINSKIYIIDVNIAFIMTLPVHFYAFEMRSVHLKMTSESQIDFLRRNKRNTIY